ncbi:DUF4870 domain-containing protein [Cylindrospermopsis curvispora]|uniref:DUF4870 domain-containing protein n=1 Tax=Cylindrospermopsis curvispora GIHE-G1 TaxID=2666332 RepID=A0A7H0F583_9CYAN|nr:DUF4870 domain-containing protein [Cylindrospermopsis curvispora]QNP31199.1 DUF4870 domain-containing protein [Cylindrospermopsis curvispora GIHE-G1]BAZ90556.1 hypothetical protein NIES932_20560 [Raphidiopsis curvata NIES-932]
MYTGFDQDKRKILSALCHGAIFFSTTVISVGLPVAILIISDDPVVKDNAKESINFHFNVWFYGAILAGLFFLLGWLVLPLIILLPLAGVGYLIHWALTIFAIVKVLTNPDLAFSYPFIFRVF